MRCVSKNCWKKLTTIEIERAYFMMCHYVHLFCMKIISCEKLTACPKHIYMCNNVIEIHNEA